MVQKRHTLHIILIALIVSFSTVAHGKNAIVASGEASKASVEAAINILSASADLSAAGLELGGNIAIELGKPLANIVLTSAEVSMESVAFSTEVLADGFVTTAMLSNELAHAGIDLSVDAAQLAASATAAGITMSAETAGLFLHQAVNIAAASGRLSGEVAKLSVALAAAGVELSVDSAKLVADAAAKGVTISEEAAKNIITASLSIAKECIAAAVVTERYILMTLEEANTLLRETSMATVAAAIKTGRQTVEFTAATASHLKQLGINSVKYSKELSKRAATAAVNATIVTVNGANDATVVVINTGSGLIVASLDTLTAAVEKTTKKIQP
ncbi:MAG: hypothetical protein D3917_07465 [Candidatus Electrothrix sp. AX5]|nr:hypothetical protein [Candidatus Electrothrix sp. AX5]